MDRMTFEAPIQPDPEEIEPEPEPEPEGDQPEEPEEPEVLEPGHAEPAPAARELTPPPKLQALDVRAPEVTTFELDQRRAKAYAESGYWSDTRSLAQALVKIEAGRPLGIPPMMAMNEVHVIEGKPSLGAGALAALVRASKRYDYRIQELNEERCELWFYAVESGELLGTSVFTLDHARAAGLLDKKGDTWKKYPRNMLFARAMSNGVAFHCPDVTMGRVYIADEISDSEVIEQVVA